MNTTPVVSSPSNSFVSNVSKIEWEKKAPIAKRDLTIKQVAITILFLLNLAGVLSLLIFILQNYPLPSLEGIATITPFAAGIVATLVFLKIPMCGANERTVSNLTNLPMTISRVLSLVFFGPTVIAKNNLDLRDYGDPHEAARIKYDFETKDTVYLMENYGPCIPNLLKYGYLIKEDAATFQTHYERTKEDVKLFKYHARNIRDFATLANLEPELKARLFKNEDWKKFQMHLATSLPKIDFPRKIPWDHQLRSCFSFCLDDETPRGSATAPPSL